MNTTENDQRFALVWNDAAVLLKEHTSKDIFETWFRELSIGNISENEAVLNVPNKFFRDWIREHYQSVLEEALGTATGRSGLRVNYALSESPPKTMVTKEPDRVVQTHSMKAKRTAHIDGRYTFSTFVAGPCGEYESSRVTRHFV
jgi:chromosomal replication initiator protein